jgi:DNA-binding LacI/PurR family transcriptional regulator
MKTIQERGLRVPDDVAVVGVDDQPFAPLLNPSLTTVKLPIFEAGQKAIELLTERLRGKRTAPERVVLPMELIVRDSCGASRAAPTLDPASLSV